jgi:Fe-S-cluster containining protein
MFTNKLLKDGLKFYCEKCEYGCNKKYSWNKHLSTTKHQQIDQPDQLNDPKIAEVNLLNSQKKTICIFSHAYR